MRRIPAICAAVVAFGTSNATASDSGYAPDTPEPGSVEAISDATTIRGVSSPIATGP